MKKKNEKLIKLSIVNKELQQEKILKNNIENNKRKQNVEVSGIPVSVGENCKAIIMNIAHKLGLTDLKLEDIDVAHRLMSNPNRLPPIIVLFATRTICDTYVLRFKPTMYTLTLQDLDLVQK